AAAAAGRTPAPAALALGRGGLTLGGGGGRRLRDGLAGCIAAGRLVLVRIVVVPGRPRRGLRLGRYQHLRHDLANRDLLLDVGLDLRQRLRVQVAGEADRVTLGAQARGAADAVHVVLGIV